MTTAEGSSHRSSDRLTGGFEEGTQRGRRIETKGSEEKGRRKWERRTGERRIVGYMDKVPHWNFFYPISSPDMLYRI